MFLARSFIVLSLSFIRSSSFSFAAGLYLSILGKTEGIHYSVVPLFILWLIVSSLAQIRSKWEILFSAWHLKVSTYKDPGQKKPVSGNVLMIGLQPALTTIQNKSSNQQYPEPNMQTEDDLNSTKNDDSGSVYPIHLRGSRLANPSSATHQPWKRTYVISSSKTTNEHKTHKQISSGGRIALILALAGMMYCIR